MTADFIRAEHPELGDMFVAWRSGVDHVEPGVRSSRFAARLAPFRNRDDAERARIEAGAVFDGVQP